MSVKHLLLASTLALTAACSSKNVIDENLSEAELYRQAQAQLNDSNFSRAVDTLKAMESRYPFGHYSEQSQLELVYAYYQSQEPEAAKAAADRFIRLHPQHANVDYAWYMKGLSSFEQDRSFLARFLPLDLTKRDPGAARDSFNEFAQLVARFPNSRYAPDAKARMIYLRNMLAAYDVHVAHYYLKRGAYVAAANRGRFVVENFQQTPAVADGLAIMIEAYMRTGLDDLAATSLATLKLNYPDHPSLVKGQFVPREEAPDTRSWLNKATLGFVDGGAPLPPGKTRASEDMERMYRDAKDAIPDDIQKNESKKAKATVEEPDAKPHRSVWSRATFGLFD